MNKHNNELIDQMNDDKKYITAQKTIEGTAANFDAQANMLMKAGWLPEGYTRIIDGLSVSTPLPNPETELEKQMTKEEGYFYQTFYKDFEIDEEKPEEKIEDSK